MIRAGAKNHESIAVVVDPDDYAAIIGELREHSAVLSDRTKRQLASKAFCRTATYDAAIGNWLLTSNGDEFPDYYATGGKRLLKLRYGENPHQKASFYSTGTAGLLQVHGKELSYNNINDTDAAWRCVSELGDKPACVIVKHANPCGVAVAGTLAEAYRLALRCDPLSAYGGIVALSRPLDEETAVEIVKILTYWAKSRIFG
jgi:phosphoribosylaminoimidazolecarboxamide formyltransferase/IMP cyclohydrolase